MPGQIPIGDDAHLPGAAESRHFHADLLQQATPDLDVITPRTQFKMDRVSRHIRSGCCHELLSRDLERASSSASPSASASPRALRSLNYPVGNGVAQNRMVNCTIQREKKPGRSAIENGEETRSMGFAPIETAYHHQWGRLLACRAGTCQVAERTIVGVRKINSSCFETFSVLFLNSQPRTGTRDRYGIPATLFDCVSTNTPPMTMVSPSRTST